MGSGFYLMHRGWMDNPIFKEEPFTEKFAWLWLIEKASFEPHKIRYKDEMIEVGRGQVPTSYRRLKDCFKWGNDRVRRFLDLLESEKMISRKTGTGFLVITICNYNEYQLPLTNTGTEAGTMAGTHTGTEAGTNIKNINKLNKLNEEENPLPLCIPIDAWEAFSEMRHKIKSPMTTKAKSLLIAKLIKFHAEGFDIREILEESTMNNWKGVFLKEKNHAKRTSQPIERSKTSDSLAALMAAGDRISGKQFVEPESSRKPNGAASNGNSESRAGTLDRIAETGSPKRDNGNPWKADVALPYDEHDEPRKNYATGGLYS